MAGDELIFDLAKCNVDAVTKIPPEGLLTDTTVPTAPDPITDCQLAPIVSLPKESPCPDLTVNNAAIFQGVRADASVITEPTVIFTVTRGTCCEFDFDLLIEIPDSCPDITSSATKGNVVTVTSGTDGALPSGYIY